MAIFVVNDSHDDAVEIEADRFSRVGDSVAFYAADGTVVHVVDGDRLRNVRWVDRRPDYRSSLT